MDCVWCDEAKHKDLILHRLISGLIGGYDMDCPLFYDNQHHPIYGFGYNPLVKVRYDDLQELTKEALEFVNTKKYEKERTTNVK